MGTVVTVSVFDMILESLDVNFFVILSEGYGGLLVEFILVFYCEFLFLVLEELFSRNSIPFH